MTFDLDTFVISVYYTIDTLFQRFLLPLRPPADLLMSDSEVITLFLLFQWDPRNSERDMIRYANKYWKGYFPYILERSAFNRRIRQLTSFICSLVPLSSQYFSNHLRIKSCYELIDGVICPVMRNCRAIRTPIHDCGFDFGIGGADRRMRYGLKILTVTNSASLITGFVIAPANTDERFLAESLFRFRRDPDALVPSGPEMDLELGLGSRHSAISGKIGITGTIITAGVGFENKELKIGDLGFRGKQWKSFWKKEYGIDFMIPSDFDKLSDGVKTFRKRQLSSLRQLIETNHKYLENEFSMWYPKAKSYGGTVARIGAKYLIENICIGINKMIGDGDFKIRKFNPILN